MKAAGLLKSGSQGSVLCFILPKRMQFYSSPSSIHTPTILLSSRTNRIPRNYTTRRGPRSQQTRNFTGNSEIKNRTNLERWRNHAPDATKVPGIGTAGGGWRGERRQQRPGAGPPGLRSEYIQSRRNFREAADKLRATEEGRLRKARKEAEEVKDVRQGRRTIS